MSIELSDDDLQKCVQSSNGMTGADIKELCIQLQRATIDEVFERANEIEKLREKYSGEDYDDEDLMNLTRKTKKQLAKVMLAGRLVKATKVR
jgi:isopropylmalate/homocitrate/citramalate synthase